MNYKKFLDSLLSNDKFILTTHVSPDLDGIGAELGLHHLLLSEGKDSIILNHDFFNAAHFSLGTDHIIHNRENCPFEEKDLKQRNVVILDNSELSRIGFVENYVLEDYSNLFIIDHHDGVETKNENHFVNPNASSTCEVIYELCELMGLKLPLEVQKALYAGIVTDTGHFRYSKTSLRTHEIAIELLRSGVKPHLIAEEISARWPMERLSNKKILYSNLHFNRKKTIAWFAVRDRDLYSDDRGNNYTDGLINELLEIENIKIVLFFKEISFTSSETKSKEIKTRLSLRSKSHVNLLPLVQYFNGGGHQNACGATLDDNLEDSIEKVIDSAETLLIKNS